MSTPTSSGVTTVRLAVFTAVLAFGLCGYVSMDLCGGAFRGALITGVIVAVVDAIILAVARTQSRLLTLRLLVAAVVLTVMIYDSRLTAAEVFRIVFAVDSVPESISDVRFRRVMLKGSDDYIYLDFCSDESTLQSLLAVRGFMEDEDFWAQWDWVIGKGEPEYEKEFWQRTNSYADDPNFPDQAIPVPAFAKRYVWEVHGSLLGARVIWIPETGRAVVMYSDG